MDQERHVEALERRVDVLEAVQAIHRLKARYAELLDRRLVHGEAVDERTLRSLAEQVAELFTDDGTWDGGPTLGTAVGRTAIADRLAAPTLRFARHLFVNPRIEVAEVSATGRWELFAPMTAADGTTHLMQGVEDDTYHRVDGQWLHHSMKLTTTFVAPVTDGWGRILA